MSSVVLRSVVVGCFLVGGAAGSASAQQRPQQVSFEEALRAVEPGAAGLVAARAKIVGAQHQVDAAKSAYYPQLTGSVGYSLTLASEFDNFNLGGLVPNYGALLCPITDDAGNVFCEQRYQDIYNPPVPEGSDDSGSALPFGQRNTWRLGVNASQQIYDFGRTKAGVRSASVAVELAKLSEQQIRATAVYAASSAYFGAALAQRSVEISEQSLASAEDTLADAQLKEKNGAIAEFDVVRAEVARDTERNALVRSQSKRDQAFRSLKRLLLIPLDRPIELTTKLRLDAASGDDADDALGKALAAAGLTANSKRISLIQAELAVTASEQASALAAADRWPTITAVSDFGLVNYQKQPFNGDWANNWTVGVNVSIPIFDGFRRRALLRKADADLAAARASVVDGARAIELDAAQADDTIAAALQIWQASARTVALAQRAYEIAELRFSQGSSTQLELVDARLQLNRSQLSQASSEHDLRVARLRRALLPGLAVGPAF